MKRPFHSQSVNQSNHSGNVLEFTLDPHMWTPAALLSCTGIDATFHTL